MYLFHKPVSRSSIADRCNRWLGRGAKREGLVALLDQTVVSGAAFLTTILIGRWSGAEELGIYSLGFTLVVLMINAQAALITIPYTMQWRSRPRADQQGFAGGALIQQLILATCMSGLLGLVVILLLLFGIDRRINAMLLVVAIGMPLLLLREFTRKFAFSHLRMGTACLMDIAVSIAQISGIVLTFLTGHLSAASAFIALAVAACFGSSIGLTAMRRLFAMRLDLLTPSIRDHWRFGRWVLASSSLLTLQASAAQWMLAFVLGTAQTGVYSACLTSVLVLNPLLLGVGNILGPMTARAFAEGGLLRLQKLVWKVSSSLTPILALYAALVYAVGDQAIGFLYAGSEYFGHGHLLTVFAISVFSSALELPVDSGLQAMNRPDIGFRASVISTFLVLLLSVLLIPTYGMLGGAYAGLIGKSCGVAMRIMAFSRLCKSEMLNSDSRQKR